MIATGEVEGLGWYEIPRSIFQEWETLGFHGDHSAESITVLAPLHEIDVDRIEGMVATAAKGGALSYRFARDLGVQMVDAARQLPGRLIAYDKGCFLRFDFLGWMGSRIDIPENVDFRLEVNPHHGKAYAVAHTLKNGHEADVRRKLDREKPLLDQVGKILGYFSRNCPRIAAGESVGNTCGPHVTALLAHVDPAGHDLVSAWMSGSRREPLHIPGAMLPGSGVIELKLSKSEESEATRAQITTERITLTDDETGTTVLVAAQLPHSVVIGLKGARMADVADTQWLDGLTVRTAAATDTGQIRIRAAATGVPMVLPERREETHEETLRRLQAVFGEGRGRYETWMNIDDSAIALFSGMEPRHVATILSLLTVVGEAIDLTPYGRPHWAVRRTVGRITLERCPESSLSDFAASVARRISDMNIQGAGPD